MLAKTHVSSFTDAEITQAVVNYIEPDASNVDPANEDDLRDFAFVREQVFPAIDRSLDSTDKVHVLVLADSGMGKTTLLLNLYQGNSLVRESVVERWHSCRLDEQTPQIRLRRCPTSAQQSCCLMRWTKTRKRSPTTANACSSSWSLQPTSKRSRLGKVSATPSPKRWGVATLPAPPSGKKGLQTWDIANSPKANDTSLATCIASNAACVRSRWRWIAAPRPSAASCGATPRATTAATAPRRRTSTPWADAGAAARKTNTANKNGAGCASRSGASGARDRSQDAQGSKASAR